MGNIHSVIPKVESTWVVVTSVHLDSSTPRKFPASAKFTLEKSIAGKIQYSLEVY